MPHDHSHAHSHSHDHGHTHDAAPQGHNRPRADHLHSHMHDHDRSAELQVLSRQFIDGFIQAADKMSYLRLAGVPLERSDAAGGPAQKLVDVKLETEWQVGTASPSFGSQDLSYLPFPGEMITERTNMQFVYVSLRSKSLVDLREFLLSRPEINERIST